MSQHVETFDANQRPQSAEMAEGSIDSVMEAAKPDYFSQLADVKENILQGVITAW
jgi:hypothetical protein